jgi:hypothetical protein
VHVLHATLSGGPMAESSRTLVPDGARMATDGPDVPPSSGGPIAAHMGLGISFTLTRIRRARVAYVTLLSHQRCI